MASSSGQPLPDGITGCVMATTLKPQLRSRSSAVFAISPPTGILNGMHLINGVRDPATSFPLDTLTDDAGERRQANRAIAVSAVGLALTGLVELAIALLSGSVALLGDALHNLSDVSTSALVFVGFRASRRLPSERYPSATSAPRTSPESVWHW